MKSLKKLDIDKVLGEVFKEYRVKNKLTQEKIAEKLGISVKYISRIEKKVIKKLKGIFQELKMEQEE